MLMQHKNVNCLVHSSGSTTATRRAGQGIFRMANTEPRNKLVEISCLFGNNNGREREREWPRSHQNYESLSVTTSKAVQSMRPDSSLLLLCLVRCMYKCGSEQRYQHTTATPTNSNTTDILSSGMLVEQGDPSINPFLEPSLDFTY